MITSLALLESLVQHTEHKFRGKLEKPRQIELYDLYIGARFSTHTIARLYETTNSVVMNWLSHYEISTRKREESQLHNGSKKPSKEELNQLYVTEKRSSKYIAEICHVDKGTIYSWLDKYQIERRRKSNHLIR